MNKEGLLAIGAIAIIMALAFYSRMQQTRNKVLRLLKKHGIPYKSWEPGILEGLFESVDLGEIWLGDTEYGSLISHVNVAVVTIRCIPHRGERCVLREIVKHPDGLWRQRPFPGSVSGKIRKSLGESAKEAIQRELGEELGQSKPEFKDHHLYTLSSGDRKSTRLNSSHRL